MYLLTVQDKKDGFKYYAEFTNLPDINKAKNGILTKFIRLVNKDNIIELSPDSYKVSLKSSGFPEKLDFSNPKSLSLYIYHHLKWSWKKRIAAKYESQVPGTTKYLVCVSSDELPTGDFLIDFCDRGEFNFGGRIEHIKSNRVNSKSKHYFYVYVYFN